MQVNLQQRLLTFAQAANLLPSRPHRSTLIRWATRGIRRVKLETIRIGGRRFVSEEALGRFITAVNDAADGSHSHASNNADDITVRAAEKAGQKLDALVFGHPQRKRGVSRAKRVSRVNSH